MRRHWSYLKYVLRHKWYVLLECVRLDAGLWRGLVHDWSKFLPSEWHPYAFTFYGPDGAGRYLETTEFNQAWNAHQKRQPHHWQYWVLRHDDGGTSALPMPTVYIREMVADWVGAGKAIPGGKSAIEWYAAYRQRLILEPATRFQVEVLLGFDPTIHVRVHPRQVKTTQGQSHEAWGCPAAEGGCGHTMWARRGHPPTHCDHCQCAFVFETVATKPRTRTPRSRRG